MIRGSSPSTSVALRPRRTGGLSGSDPRGTGGTAGAVRYRTVVRSDPIRESDRTGRPRRLPGRTVTVSPRRRTVTGERGEPFNSISRRSGRQVIRGRAPRRSTHRVTAGPLSRRLRRHARGAGPGRAASPHRVGRASRSTVLGPSRHRGAAYAGPGPTAIMPGQLSRIGP
eukprot:768444-Hanusia_phi.AAC.4